MCMAAEMAQDAAESRAKRAEADAEKLSARVKLQSDEVAGLRSELAQRPVAVSAPARPGNLRERVEDRLKCFQKGPYTSVDNEHDLRHVQEAMHWLQQRTIARMRRGVEGTLAH